ncbi:hypothetical protein WMF37_28820 [Sorangium sp. So ce291]|uniref:hypothetical protein n=1 Tax=Sorangium sp. So ce291 TaxID=3133294 RepID=UPI003F63686A
MGGTSVSSSELANPGDTLALRVDAAASEGVYLVEAELGGSTIELVRGSSGFEGIFDLSGLPYGPHHLTVRVYDLLGDGVTAERTVLRYAPPTIRLANPRPNSVVSGRPRIQVQCIGAAPYDCEYACAELRSQRRYVGSGCGVRPEGAPPGLLQFGSTR